MKRTVHIQGKILWKWGRTSQGNYIAVCDSIAQTVQASRFGELLETMQEALESTFRELFSSGDLENFLHERGWSTDLPVPSIPGTQKNSRFEMPFDLKGVRKRDLEEALC